MIMGNFSRRALLGVLAATALALPGCGVAGERLPDYRYRLTVEVDTPEGVKTGSSVIEVSTALAGKFKLPDANALKVDVRGQAVAVDLGQRGVLFALLRSENSVGWAGGAMNLVTPPPPPKTKPFYPAWHARIMGNTGVHVVPRQSAYTAQPWERPINPDGPPRDYPMLVRFRALADPTSVERVDPDALAARFGKGVALKRITVQITTDPVTTGIEKRLRWLDHLETYRSDPTNPFTSTLPSEIGGLRSK